MNNRKYTHFLTRLSSLLLVLTLLLSPAYQAAQAAEGPEISEEAALSGSRQPETLSAGGYHTCGLQSDGTVVCWGRNDYGQSTPPVGTFIQLSAGGAHTLVIAWADDVTDTIDLAPGVMDFALSHTYTAAATYTVTVMLSDDDGGNDITSFILTVAPKSYIIWLSLVAKNP
jgi:hypothetical protein